MIINWETLISTGIGALLGSILTLVATFIAHKLDQHRANSNEDKLIHGFLQGIHDEIETLWEDYNEKIGMRLESLTPNQSFNYYWLAYQDYFTIYTSNAHLIGKVDDHDLRKQIVSTYSKAKGLLDSYRMNNEMLHKFEQAAFLHQESGDANHDQQARALLQNLTLYAESLKQSHIAVKADVSSLLRILRKKGVLAVASNN